MDTRGVPSHQLNQKLDKVPTDSNRRNKLDRYVRSILEGGLHDFFLPHYKNANYRKGGFALA